METICLARCSLPVRDKRMDLYAFARAGTEEPDVAVLVNGFKSYRDDAALLRIHSACFTGDVLDSAKCDCGPQLAFSLDMISRAPWGILLYYLRHEGRGIGLVTKLRAYSLQEEGYDTVSANTELHAPIDAREYQVGMDALEYLGVDRVWLLTNNPDKVNALPPSITVEGVQQVTSTMTVFNANYLETKRLFFGHQFVGHQFGLDTAPDDD